MKQDAYTKIVLTVIAICLVVLTFRHSGFFTPAYAGTPGNLPGQNKKYGLVPVNEDGSINVRLTNGELIDVKIRSIDWMTHLPWDKIEVRTSN